MARPVKLGSMMVLPVVAALALLAYAVRDRPSSSRHSNNDLGRSPAPAKIVKPETQLARLPTLATSVAMPHGSAPVELATAPAPAPSSDSEETDMPEARKRMASARVFVHQPSEAGKQERDDKVAALVKSGPGGSQYLSQMEAIERAWLTLDKSAGLGIDISTWDCYRGGCSVTVTLPSAEDQDRFNRLVRTNATATPWKGDVFFSGPVRADSGQVEVSWLFYAPAGGA